MESTQPKIICFDLEVAPALGWFYPPTYETRVLEVKERQKLMSFAWQMVGEEEIKALNLSHMKGYKKDRFADKELATELHKVMSDADILLGQNSDRFDVRMANYFFVVNGLPPIPPKKYLDTKKIASRYFKFLNNTLDNLGKELGHGGKTEMTYADLWIPAFLEGRPEAWELMDEYCKNDVDKTTKIYLDLRGFMHTHPSLSRISGDWDSCPRCGSYDYKIKAHRTTNTQKYTQYECNDCHGYFTDRLAEKEDNDHKPKFVSV